MSRKGPSSQRLRFAPYAAIALCLVVGTWVSANIQWGGNRWDSIIESDAKGYYAYLPAVFIYNDLNFGFFDSLEAGKYYNENFFYDYRIGAHGKVINKYYSGTAVAQLPFFLIAHAYAKSQDADPDGYSKPYPILVNVAALCYLLLGLLLLNGIFKHYHISPVNSAIALLCIFFGSNLFYYAVQEPGMSHVFSFAFVSLFVFSVLRFFRQPRAGYFLLTCFALGMVVLIRPVNGLVVFTLPFLAGSRAPWLGAWQWVKDHKFVFASGALLAAGIVAIQLVYYKLATGHWLVYSYGEEGFNFADPHFFDILFSYRKGLFLYTPLYLVSLAGLWYIARTSRFAAMAGLGFLVLLIYVLSSWWMWYYGGSFSGRVFIEFMPFFAILLGVALQQMAPRGRRWYIALLAVVVMLCQFQTYQYRSMKIHWSDMNKEMYWDVFLKL